MIHNCDSDRLLAAIDRFPEMNLLVIGDIMLDEFVWGTVTRISPEAPVPVVEVARETRLLGGAANVVNNIASIGGKAGLCGVIGADPGGAEILSMLESQHIDHQGIFTDADRPTTIKTRVVAHAQQVVRFDRELRKPMAPGPAAMFLAAAERAVRQADAVIISDYGKGVVSEPLMDMVRRVSAETGRPVAVDPKVSNFHLYREVTVITPNHHEASAGANMTVESEEDLLAVGRHLRDSLDCRMVLITRGEQGMTLFSEDADPAHIPTVARKVYDVTGAGDTVIAVFTLGLAAGLTPIEAAVLANYAAGVVVGQVGTSTVTAEDLKRIVPDGARRRGA